MQVIILIVSAAVVLAVSGCGQTAPGCTRPPPPNVSNDAIIKAVLTYKACPSQAATLESIAAKVLAQHNATVLGTAVLSRYGDQARVAIAYEQQGSHGEATFTYNLSTGNVTASNPIGEQILTALSAECG
jgi:hypothetical protein